jgi:hypothetical protein
MNSRKCTTVSLVLSFVLLVTTSGTTQAGASSRSEKLPGRGVAETLKAAALGEPFLIGDFPDTDSRDPAIAYNSQRQEYLVVWSNDRYGCDDVYGRRLNADGILLGPRFPIGKVCPGEQQYPDVAYNSLHDEYLVIWYHAAGDTVAPFCIRGQRLSGSGDLLGAVIDITDCSSTTYYAYNPAVDYASTSDMYEVVWSGGAASQPSLSIQGQAVSSSGALSGARSMIAQGDADWSYEVPDLAYNHRQNGYLVVYQRRGLVAPIGYAIYAHLVHGAGSPTGGSIEIMRVSSYQMSPAVAAMPSAYLKGQYLVVWEDEILPGYRQIDGRLVNGDGSIFSNTFPVTDADGHNHMFPVAAADDRAQRYLVAWTDDSSTPGSYVYRIYGRLVSTSGISLGGPEFVGGVFAYYPVLASGPHGDFLVAFHENEFPVKKVVMGVFWGIRLYLPLLVKH